MHTIRMKKYATGDPKDAFRALMEAVEHKVHLFRKDCWNITLELLADHLGLMSNPWRYSLPNAAWRGAISQPSYQGLGELKKQIPVDLIEAYIAAAKARKEIAWDYPGEIFAEDELAGRHNRLGQCLTPRNIIDFMLKCTMDENLKKNKPYSYAKPDLSLLIWQTREALAFNDALPINLLTERARQHTVIGMTPLLVKYEQKPVTQLDT